MRVIHVRTRARVNTIYTFIRIVQCAYNMRCTIYISVIHPLSKLYTGTSIQIYSVQIDIVILKCLMGHINMCTYNEHFQLPYACACTYHHRTDIKALYFKQIDYMTKVWSMPTKILSQLDNKCWRILCNKHKHISTKLHDRRMKRHRQSLIVINWKCKMLKSFIITQRLFKRVH